MLTNNSQDGFTLPRLKIKTIDTTNRSSSSGDDDDDDVENSEIIHLAEKNHSHVDIQSQNLNKISEDNKTQKRQITINYVCLCIFAFLLGADFAVIIPTLWDRLSQDYSASGSFMGLVMSSYSLTGVIFGVVLGKLSDSVNKTKAFYLVCIVLSILGHALYFVGINKYGILAARSLSGLALGASPVALAYIAKTTNEKQRITVLAFIMGSRQIGLMFGPAFNIFLRKANFFLFNTFVVDRKSSPGLFMMLLWSMCFVLVTIIYKDLRTNSRPGKKSSVEQQITTYRLNYKKEFCRVEIIVMLAATFFTYFNQTSLETILIPFTELMFGWSELENSILFCIAGTFIIISFIFIRILSSKLSDKVILLMGLIVIFLGLAIGCAFLSFAKLPEKQVQYYIDLTQNETELFNSNNETTIRNSNLLNETSIGMIGSQNRTRTVIVYDKLAFVAFVTFVVFDVFGLPAIAICSASLFTKIISFEAQGFGQGIQRGILGLGTIFGPLIAGPFVQKPIYLLACTLFLISMILILIFFSFNRLNPISNVNEKESEN